MVKEGTSSIKGMFFKVTEIRVCLRADRKSSVWKEAREGRGGRGCRKGISLTRQMGMGSGTPSVQMVYPPQLERSESA